MTETNLWIITFAIVGIVAILALFGMVTMTGYAAAEHGTEVHTTYKECVDGAIQYHQFCINDDIPELTCKERLRSNMEDCITQSGMGYVELA